MKVARSPVSLLCSVFFCLCALGLPQVRGGTISTFSGQFSVNEAIPDGSPIGLVDTQRIDTDIIEVTDMTIAIDIPNGFNGDLYAYLSFQTGFAVLLNRSGRTAQNPFGYADEGFDITFDDTAPNGDIHLYQLTLDPALSPLTGTWQPSGRDIDPAAALDTTPRTATLSSFHGLDPSGDWTLFVADVETGGVATLESWSIEITGIIPEPSSAFLGLLGVGSLVLRRTRPRSLQRRAALDSMR